MTRIQYYFIFLLHLIPFLIVANFFNSKIIFLSILGVWFVFHLYLLRSSDQYFIKKYHSKEITENFFNNTLQRVMKGKKTNANFFSFYSPDHKVIVVRSLFGCPKILISKSMLTDLSEFELREVIRLSVLRGQHGNLPLFSMIAMIIDYFNSTPKYFSKHRKSNQISMMQLMIKLLVYPIASLYKKVLQNDFWMPTDSKINQKPYYFYSNYVERVFHPLELRSMNI